MPSNQQQALLDCDCGCGVCSGCCPEGVPKTLYISGGHLGDTVLALGCEDCDIGPCDDATLKIWKGSFITDWYYMTGFGSGCDLLSRSRFRMKLNFEWTCGSGYNLSVVAEVYEYDPAYDPISGIDSSYQNVSFGCDPLLNIFDDICLGMGWKLAFQTDCLDTPPDAVPCPQTYVVTI